MNHHFCQKGASIEKVMEMGFEWILFWFTCHNFHRWFYRGSSCSVEIAWSFCPTEFMFGTIIIIFTVLIGLTIVSCL